MNINTISYWIAEAFAGIIKNQKIFWTGVVTMTLALMLISMFCIFYFIADDAIDKTEEVSGKIEVFQDYKTAHVNVRLINNDSSKLDNIKKEILNYSDVKMVEYIKPEENEIRKYSGDIPFASEGFVRVTVEDFRLAKNTIEKIRNIDGVSKGENDIIITSIDYDLLNNLYAISGVKSIEYISKEDAMIRAKKSVPAGMTEGVPDDIYPASYIITVENLEQAEDIAIQVRSIDGVGEEEDDVMINKDVRWISKIAISAKVLAITIFIVVTVGACYMVMNSIKLILYARRKEISVMKYVGATDTFTKAPFIIEGLIMALVSVGITAILTIALSNSFAAISEKVLFLSFMGAAEKSINAILIIILILGIGIGTCGSSMSINKYLDV